MAGPKKATPKATSVIYRIVAEASEIGLGFIGGQAGSIVLREVINAFMAGKVPTDTISWGDAASLRKSASDRVKKETGDNKLAELFDQFVATRVNIMASGKSDVEKQAALLQADKDYKAAVNERKLALAEQKYQGVLSSLTPDERYVYSQWLENYTITHEMRQRLLERKTAITQAATIRETIDIGRKIMQADTIPDLYLRWTWVAVDAGWRAAWERASKAMYDYLINALPAPTVGERLGSVVNAALEGRLAEHPVVRRLAAQSDGNVAQRREQADMIHRCHENRRKV